MALTGIALSLLLFLLTHRMVKPLRELSEDAIRVAQGNYDIRVRHISAGEIGTLAKSMREMTDHIRDEAAIARSVQLSIESPFFMADKDTTITYINKSACELMRVTPEDIVGKMKVFDLFGSEKATRSALSGKPLPGYEVNIRNRENEIIPVIASSGPIRKADGEIVGAFLTFIDMRRMVDKQRAYLEEQIKPIENAVLSMASGDFTCKVEFSEENQLHKLGKEVAAMIESLRLTLERVSETSSAVASASAEISSSTEELSAGAQEQSLQTSEVAAAVEEMTRTVIDNSKNATQTADIAKDNGVVAEQGGQIVAETVRKIREIAAVVQDSAATVERLGSSTQEIGEIILVIDDIADQTNLLALNAAIEAARAGEEGRGFAVVADEVRKLAERTTQATKQIAGMIKNVQAEAKAAVDSMKRGSAEVGEGIKLADKAGESLKNIVGNTQQVVDMMTQIAAASEEQSSTSEQISRNVESISTVSAESANGISQIARAADDLNRLTDSLQNIISNFKLHRQDRGVPGFTPAANRGTGVPGKIPILAETVKANP
jgi:PAS domain S-box-containing protein